MVAAINNVRPIITQRVWSLAFGFGLIHGFGFANVLQELGLPKGALALCLFGFNLGVELGQVAIVGLCLPLAYAWRKRWFYQRIALALGSAGIAAIAFIWFVERALDLPPLLPSAPQGVLAAELKQVMPYLPAHLTHPFIAAGALLLIVLGVYWTLCRIGLFITPGDDSKRVRRFTGSARAAALGILVLGIAIAYSEAKQDAAAEVKATGIKTRLAGRLRQRLRVSEPGDMAYQTQLTAISDAVIFLARHEGQHSAPASIAEALDQLEQGETDRAEAVLKIFSNENAAKDRLRQSAVAERHRAALAVVDDPEQAIVAYRRAVQLEPESWHGWDRLGYLLQRIGQFGEAKTAYQRALSLAQAGKDRTLAGVAYENLGTLYQCDGALQDAKAMYHEALGIHRERRDEVGLARVHTHLGNLYGSQGRFEQAQAMYRDALSIHQTLGDKVGTAIDYANLGGAYVAQGMLRQGEAMYRKALLLNESIGRKASMAVIYADLGYVYEQLGDAKRAEHTYQQALAIDKALDYKPGLASDYTSLGVLYRRLGDLDKAKVEFHRALTVDESIDNKHGLVSNYANLGHIYQAQRKFGRAEKMYKKALTINEALDEEGAP